MSDAQAADSNALICHCMRVPRARIIEAIRNGARSVEDLQLATTACTGCGTCRWDLEELLAAYGHNQSE